MAPLPTNQKEGGWRTVPPAPPACVQSRGQAGRGRAGRARQGGADHARAGGGCTLPHLRPRLCEKGEGAESGCAQREGGCKGGGHASGAVCAKGVSKRGGARQWCWPTHLWTPPCLLSK